MNKLFRNILIVLVFKISYSVYVSNLDSNCLTCICVSSTGCNESFSCMEGICGPFFLTVNYWNDADNYVSAGKDPGVVGAFEDCALDYDCASQIVATYMSKFGRDCNGDGITDCDDYAMVHFNGGPKCEDYIEDTTFYERYTRCRHLDIRRK